MKPYGLVANWHYHPPVSNGKLPRQNHSMSDLGLTHRAQLDCYPPKRYIVHIFLLYTLVPKWSACFLSHCKHCLLPYDNLCSKQ